MINLYQHFFNQDCNQRRKKETYKIEAILQTQLPNTCRLIGGVTSGVILSNMNLEATEIEENDAFGIFLLPEFANVTIGDFYLDYKKMKQVTKVNMIFHHLFKIYLYFRSFQLIHVLHYRL